MLTQRSAPIPFRKMHGLGNDFVVIDARQGAPDFTRAEIERIADRRFGIGCDQLILLENSPRADAFMRIFNPDASEAWACGNATRCIGALLAAQKGAASATIETRAGLLTAQVGDDGGVTVDMGLPRLGWRDIPLAGAEADTLRVPFADAPSLAPDLPDWFSAVNMGNPHALFFVRNIDAFDLSGFGARIETHPIFPEKANISLVEKTGDDALRLRVWERGAGMTLACGTAACAAAVAAGRLGLASGTIRVALPGGGLAIARDERGHVMMRGAVATTFSGHIDPSLVAGRG